MTGPCCGLSLRAVLTALLDIGNWHWKTKGDGVDNCFFVCLSLCMLACLCVSVRRKRTCRDPILPHKPPKTQLSSQSSVSKVKRVVEQKSSVAKTSPDVDKSKQSTPDLNTPKPDIEATPDSVKINDSSTGRRGHKLFGRKKFASASSSLNRLKPKADRESSVDAPWKRRKDPWKKRRSLLASDRPASGSSWSPRRVPSSSSLASLSDTDGSKQSSGASQSRNLLKVLLRLCFLFL